MKKFISLLICLILIIGICIPAYAFNINDIQPDTSVVIIGITGEDVPVTGPLPHYNAGPNTVVIINPNEKIEDIFSEKEETNKPVAQNTTEETSTDDTTQEEAVTPKEEINLTALQTEIYALINEERIAKDVQILEYNFDLQKAADIRAKEASKQFTHTRLDGTEFATVLDPDIEYEIAGENLLLIDKPIADAEVIVDTWMHSEGHMKNILTKEFYETAIGVFEHNGVIYIAQLFIG